MPERNPEKPQFVAGTTLESGTPNTGQVLNTHGGSKTYNRYSGTAGGDTNIHVGGGRLDVIIPHVALSGVAVVFYDSATAVSGGPFAASGHKIVGVMPANTAAGGGGAGIFGAGPLPYSIGMVFTSGLCHTGASGQAGFSVGYTPTISG